VTFEIHLWYNLYFGSDKTDGLFLTLGGGFKKRVMNLELVTEASESVMTERVLHDVDYLTKVFVTAGYRF